MKVITVNLNGIRSAHRKGIFEWLALQQADFICLQELKAHLDVIPHELLNWDGYYSYFHPAKKRGYSGVGIYAKHKPKDIIIGLNDDKIDQDGRYIQLNYDEFSISSIYLPSGSAGGLSQQRKSYFMDFYQPVILGNLRESIPYIICGDFNIAHQNIDIKNWRGNLKSSGFLPEERQWVSQLIDAGFVDTWRVMYPEAPGYTWWSNFGNAYANDAGWRIDYQFVSPQLAKFLLSGEVFKGIKFSDHAPLIVEYDL